MYTGGEEEERLGDDLILEERLGDDFDFQLRSTTKWSSMWKPASLAPCLRCHILPFSGFYHGPDDSWAMVIASLFRGLLSHL